MYAILIQIHSVLRWAVLLTAVLAVASAWMGASGGRPYKKGLSVSFVVSVHVQLLIGLVLYAVSPLREAAFADFGAAMKAAPLRFVAVEHILMMLIAAVVATIGSARARRAASDIDKNKKAALFFTIALVIMLVAIPWPFRGNGVGRPLLPGMTSEIPATVAPAPPAG